MATELGARLEKLANMKFTGKSFCHSVCTQLVEASISVIGLCEARNWKNINIAQEYSEHSNKLAASYIDMLDGNKYKLNDYIDLSSKCIATSIAVVGATRTSNSSANSNCMIININSTMFMAFLIL